MSSKIAHIVVYRTPNEVAKIADRMIDRGLTIKKGRGITRRTRPLR